MNNKEMSVKELMREYWRENQRKQREGGRTLNIIIPNESFDKLQTYLTKTKQSKKEWLINVIDGLEIE